MTSGKHTKLKEASNMPSFCLASVMLPKREREKKKEMMNMYKQQKHIVY